MASPIIRHISYQAGGAEKELFQEHRKWTVPSGARVTIAVEAPPNCIGLRIGGSGGLNTALEKNPGTGLWNAAFTVWESGAFFFRTLETDGTRGGSDLYTFEIQEDTPPAVTITAPENLEVLLHPAAVTVEAKDDSALGNVLLRLNNMNGGIDTPGSAALTGTEREFKETFTLSVTKSARLLTSVIAIAAEAEENSPLRRNAFTDIHFHPLVLESESEMLNDPQVIRAFQEWRKKRKYQEPNKQIPPPESPDTRNQQDKNEPSTDAPEQSGYHPQCPGPR